MTSVRINGLRLSGRLCRLCQEMQCFPEAGSVYLSRKLALSRINITFFLLDCLSSPARITCLVAPESLAKYGDSAYFCADTGNEPGSGLVSLFPHRFDPAVFGAVFRAVDSEKLPWHCMATSGSMLTMATGFDVQLQTALSISSHFDLPPDHGPFRPEPDYDIISRRLKTAPETVAQYVEEKVRTYGIQVKTGLTLCCIRTRPENQFALGNAMEALGSAGFCFVHASADRISLIEIQAVVVLQTSKSGSNGPGIASYFPKHLQTDLEIRRNVQVISFHGPHFGDRYGIADKALSCLSDYGIPVWMAGCVGATVTLVLPPDTEKSALYALSAAFDHP